MIIYWSMVVFTIVLYFLQKKLEYNRIYLGDKYIFKGDGVIAILWGGYLLFWIGLRSGIADTNAYIAGFEEIPLGLGKFREYITSVDKGVGFQVIAFLIKNFLSDNYHVWLILITFISLFCLIRVFYKHCENFVFTAYLFLTSCIFTWLLNGIRQFLAACILFLFSDWLVEDKVFRYMILILLVSLIHNTALVFIPICLFFRKKDPWTWKTVIFLLIFMVGVYYSNSWLHLFTETEMGSGYAEALTVSKGTNFIRVLVAAVPCILAFAERDIIALENDKFINLCVIMSIVSLCFYILSSVTSGVLLGRLPNYFEIYNLILLPWLLNRGFERRSKKIVTAVCIVLYLFFFYYQMTQAWNMYYVSDFTGVIR